MAKDPNFHLISYQTVRQFIGGLGLILPIVLVASSIWCDTPIQSSISAYYYTNLGDLLVGFLTAIAVFLFAYRGYEAELDHWITNIAGIGALGIAFFPCEGINKQCIRCKEPLFSDSIYQILHLASASIFFLSLAVMLLFFFTRSDKTCRAPHKLIRNYIYYTCGAIMILCILLIFACFQYNWFKGNIFWLESLAMFAFGFGWLVKGEIVLKD